MSQRTFLLPAKPALPQPGHRRGWGRLIGASAPLAAAELSASLDAPLLVLADDPRHADQFAAGVRFFAGDDVDIRHFVEWETLPWDNFSPHQDIISERLSVLATRYSDQSFDAAVPRRDLVVVKRPVDVKPVVASGADRTNTPH